MLAAGPSAVTAVVDTEATEGVGSGVVFSRGEVGLLAVSATGRAVDGWVVGPCVDVLSAWGLVGSEGLAVGSVGLAVGSAELAVGGLGLAVGSMGLAVESTGPALGSVGPVVGSEGLAVGSPGPAVEWRGVCSAGLCEPRALPAFAVVAAAVCVLVASVVRGAVVGHVPLLGAWVRGVLGAAVGAGGGRVAVGVGTLESVRLAGPAAAAEVPTAVPGVLPAGIAGELGLAPKGSLADVTGEGVVMASEVLFKMLPVISLDVFLVTKAVWLKTTGTGPRGATRLSERDREEMQASTRADHILWASREQGWRPRLPAALSC